MKDSMGDNRMRLADPGGARWSAGASGIINSVGRVRVSVVRSITTVERRGYRELPGLTFRPRRG